MRLLLLRGWCLFLLLAASSSTAQEKQPAADDLLRAAKYIVHGKVERVYSTEKRLTKDTVDLLYAIEVTVSKIRRGESMLVGEAIFVKTWKASKRPLGSAGTSGQTEIPQPGDLVELYLNDGLRSFEALLPNGIKIALPGSYRSKSIGLEMVAIEAGEFSMGSPMGEVGRRVDELRHRVRITRPFFLGVHEVTQDEYLQVMQVNPSWFAKASDTKGKIPFADTKRFPVEQVTWYDAIEFCNRLSKRDGFEPYYQATDVKREKDAITSATVTIVGGNGYRLPTEAEWEYACRAGTNDLFHFGSTNTGREANVLATLIGGGYGLGPKWNSLGRTTHVGSYPPNRWGLYDMHGNAAEWCWDWYDKDYYANAPVDDPRGPVKGIHRVLRGGSWLVNETNCRAASRLFHVPEERKYYGGFRVARNP